MSDEPGAIGFHDLYEGMNKTGRSIVDMVDWENESFTSSMEGEFGCFSDAFLTLTGDSHIQNNWRKSQGKAVAKLVSRFSSPMNSGLHLDHVAQNLSPLQ